MAISVLVRGIGDVGSAVAWVLFKAGRSVLILDSSTPVTHRRMMGFADAMFDGEAVLEGVTARRCQTLAQVTHSLHERDFIPVVTGELQYWLDAVPWKVFVDARMRKREPPPPRCNTPAMMIGLGPGHVAGVTADFAIETKSGEHLGSIVYKGATLPLAGGPCAIEGVGRERIVYAPVSGLLSSTRAIGDPVSAGEPLANIDSTLIRAPISGTLRGLTRPGVSVRHNDKVVEVDPRPPERAGFKGLGERPRQIGHGVEKAIDQWTEAQNDRERQRNRA